MKAISIGKRYEIYDDSLKSYDSLPAQTYTVRFGKMSGFFLEKRADLSVEEKIYGVHREKADKVFNTFIKFERNLGVILSGDKGIGKSLFARLLSSKAVEGGYPVIIIDQFIPGIASYIESIEQEAVFLFDEFDKTFGGVNPGDNESDPQAGLLSLFDGTSNGKKLFIITCNNLYKLNDYLVNRPGRFHYHFRFEYPSSEEIKEYLTDKLDTQYSKEIDKVILFSKKVALNFDCLRAIAFELNMGISFEIAIHDLNIINTNETYYKVTMHFNNGIIMTSNRCRFDLFNKDGREFVDLYNDKNQNVITVEFIPTACIYDNSREETIIPKEYVTLDYNDYYGEKVKKETEKLIPDYLSITRVAQQSIHYSTV